MRNEKTNLKARRERFTWSRFWELLRDSLGAVSFA